MRKQDELTFRIKKKKERRRKVDKRLQDLAFTRKIGRSLKEEKERKKRRLKS